MFQLFNVSRSGFGTYQKMMFNITSNIANAMTDGYRHREVELGVLFPTFFQDELSKYNPDKKSPYKMKRHGQDLLIGLKVEGIRSDYTQGALKITNNSLDAAISGNGFFRFKTPNGDLVYSRNGNFMRDNNGELLSQTGLPLEPPIRIPSMASNIIIDPEGRVFAQLDQGKSPEEIGQIIMARFKFQERLKEIGQNFVMATDTSGEATIDIPGENGAGNIVQYSRESSTVDMMKEMMNMITVKMGLQTIAKAGETISEMEKTGFELLET